jgi:hypothetical protein
MLFCFADDAGRLEIGMSRYVFVVFLDLTEWNSGKTIFPADATGPTLARRDNPGHHGGGNCNLSEHACTDGKSEKIF